MSKIRYRQVHLDFHTSEYIPDIAADFDKEEFAKTLEEAHVDSITCFARCHHGWLYYPSKKFPELIHPGLKNKNFLLEQIEACHKRGIKVPVYTTAQWDGRIMREHPEWLSVDENGEFNKVTMHCTKEGENYMSISFFPYEGSTDLQAERKLWSFGRDLELTEESVPALSQQEENREWSRKMIDSMDFEILVERAEYAEDLTFPDLPTLLSEMAKEREAAF